MTAPVLNSAVFDIVELDTNLLTPQVHLVAQVESAGRYLGIIGNADGTSKQFFLVVAPSPAEASVTIDVSATWTTDPTFTVVEQGWVRVSVLNGNGGQTIKISNNSGVLLDNTALRKDQLAVLSVLRPGKHLLSDTRGGGTCSIVVNYPTTPLPVGAATIHVLPSPGDGTKTVMDLTTATISPTQPIVVYVQDGTRLVTELQSTTDRVNGNLMTVPRPAG